MGQLSCEAKWTGGLGFEAQMRTHKLKMDAKVEAGGADQGPTPKEILLASICACSGMDVASILQKMRIHLEVCDVKAVTETTAGYPSIFNQVQMQYRIQSPDAKPEQVNKAVTLSMTKYCGVSAMVAPTSPITYQVFLNDEKVGDGKADFSTEAHG